jgi:hypothetical protein
MKYARSAAVVAIPEARVPKRVFRGLKERSKEKKKVRSIRFKGWLESKPDINQSMEASNYGNKLKRAKLPISGVWLFFFYNNKIN